MSESWRVCVCKIRPPPTVVLTEAPRHEPCLPLAVTAMREVVRLPFFSGICSNITWAGFKMSLIGPLATPFGLGNHTPGYRQLYRHRPKIAVVALDCRGGCHWSVFLSQHRQGYLSSFFFALFLSSFSFLFLLCAIVSLYSLYSDIQKKNLTANLASNIII